jgi:L-2,4-diaminobutyric acid acetyltransferase
MAGFISGYLIPERPDTLFVWQVVVAENFRGQGLAGRMLLALMEQPACKNVRFIETTITPSNEASAALFRKFARRIGAEVLVSEGFDEHLHFGGQHESEQLWRIGPVAH